MVIKPCLASTMQHLERQLPVGAAVLAAGFHRVWPPPVPHLRRRRLSLVQLQIPGSGAFVYQNHFTLSYFDEQRFPVPMNILKGRPTPLPTALAKVSSTWPWSSLPKEINSSVT
jgi:hypothetical protein